VGVVGTVRSHSDGVRVLDQQVAVTNPDVRDAPDVLRIGLLVVAAALAVSAVATAGPSRPRDPSTMRALVSEWSVVPSDGVVSAGAVRIRVRNVGVDAHELVLTRTARFADSLPLADDHAQVRAIGPTLVVGPGQTASAVFHLRPGSYVLLDNLPWHYWRGAWVAFTAR
jgi:uncharacterized cupredoxin-like copper-binding protein